MIKVSLAKKNPCQLGAVFLSQRMVRSQNFENLDRRFARSVVAKAPVRLDDGQKFCERFFVFFAAGQRFSSAPNRSGRRSRFTVYLSLTIV